jgi:hypothetical protein
MERATSYTPGESHQNQQFDHLLDTFVACRSVVRYNTTMDEEQKRALIADIDQAVRFLRNALVADTTLDAEQPSVLPPAGLLAKKEPGIASQPEQDVAGKLQALYRIYHMYLSLQQNNSIESFVARFGDVMQAINEIQNAHLYYSGNTVLTSRPLELITSFTADLYYMFVELLRSISETLEANDVHVDTEELELPSLQDRMAASRSMTCWPQFLIPLMRAYEVHQRLNTRLGRLTHRINDMIAFLEFLEEILNVQTEKREAMLSQLNNAISLLKDLSLLLVDYERATATVLRRRVGI